MVLTFVSTKGNILPTKNNPPTGPPNTAAILVDAVKMSLPLARMMNAITITRQPKITAKINSKSIYNI